MHATGRRCWASLPLVLVIGVVLQLHNPEPVYASPEESNTTDASTTPTTTTTPAWMPYVEEASKNGSPSTLTSKLCTNCTCDADTGTFDCTMKEIGPNTYSPEAWQSLNGTGFVAKRLLLVSAGLKHVTSFPPMNVTLLDLSHNEIVTIAASCFYNLTELEILDLSHNLLTTEALTPEIFEGHYSPTTYKPLEKLRVLRLGANQLHSLNADLFENMPALQELSLELNTFKVIDHQSEVAIAGIAGLVSLDLSYMELEAIPKYLLHTPRGLRYLNLTGNLLTEIPEALIYAVGLQWLSLDENPIPAIVLGNEFPPLKNLTYLSLSYMTELKMIGRGAFRGLESLEEIHITNNPHLSYLHGQAFVRNDTDNPDRYDWPPVKRFYMHNNNISYLDAQLLVQWDSMEVVDIRVNPWACDCSNRWLLLTLLPIIERTTPAILNNIECSSPKQMAGQSMIDLEHKHFHMRCPDAAGNNPSNDGALLMGLLIGVLIAIPFTAAIWCVYRRGCFGLFGRSSPAAYSRAFYSRTTLNEEF